MVRELNYDPVFDAQRHFRVLLNSMSKPGLIQVLDDVTLDLPRGLNPATALIGLALLDAEVAFWVDPIWSDLPEYLRLNTNARSAAVAAADFLFLPGSADGLMLLEAKTGSFQYPEQGATLIILVHTLSSTPLDGSLGIENKGPGVKTSNTFYIKGTNRALLECIQEKNAEFPLGLDLFFTDQQNQIISLPRSNQFTIKG